MGILIPGLVVLGLVLMAKRKGSSSNVSNAPVTAPAGGPWKVVLVSSDGSGDTYDIYAKAGSFGPHQEVAVIRFKVVDGRRVLLTEQPGLPEQMKAAARDDFGLLPVPAQF